MHHAIAELVDGKFGPKPQSEAAWERKRKTIAKQIASTENLAVATVLEQMLAFVCHIQATNIFCLQRLGQSFMLDPAILPTERFDRTPFAVIFYHGTEGFMGFQVRFRASARGGLRLLLPRNQEQRSRYRNRLLEEVCRTQLEPAPEE